VYHRITLNTHYDISSRHSMEPT